MKVKFLKNFRTFKKGEVRDINDKRANNLIENNVAERVSFLDSIRLPKFLNKIVKK